MQAIAIIAAMPQELTALRSWLENAEEHTVLGKTMHSGTIDGVPVVLAESGIGKVNAAMSTALVIEKFAPRAVVNTGSAGGLGKGIHVGDVVVGEEIAHHDVELLAFGYEKGQVPGMPPRFASDKTLLAKTMQAAQAFTGAQVVSGLIVSGDQFIDSASKIAQIRSDFPDVLACEMEAASIAQVSFASGVPFVIVRAISDHADEQADESFDEFIDHAGKQSAEMVRHFLNEMKA